MNNENIYKNKKEDTFCGKKTEKGFNKVNSSNFFLALIILISFNHFRSEQGLAPLLIGSPSLHAVCPFGGIVTIYTYFTEGAFIQKIHQSSITLISYLCAMLSISSSSQANPQRWVGIITLVLSVIFFLTS